MSTTTEQATMTAPAISCGHCVTTIQETVGALPGVAQVVADAETKQVTVAFDPSRVSLPRIEAALDEAGYPVGR